MNDSPIKQLTQTFVRMHICCELLIKLGWKYFDHYFQAFKMPWQCLVQEHDWIWQVLGKQMMLVRSGHTPASGRML